MISSMIQRVPLLFAIAHGAFIRGPVTLDAKPSINDEAALSCPLDGPVMDFHLSFQAPDEKDIVAMKTEKSATPTDEERAEMAAAMEEYKEAQEKMKAASNRMMVAMEAMLEVPVVNKAELTTMAEKGDKDTLVVFYAPWCPHCQRYVLHDGKGNPEKAPLEMFNKEMKSRGASDTLSIVRWDIDKDKDLPSQFKVQYIPTIYLAAADGTATQFKGNPTNFADMVDFIKDKSTKTKTIAPLALR